jgi:hypothetical protein
MKKYLGSGGIAPSILDLGTRWSWVVSFTPRPLYLQGKSPRYPLDRRLGGTQSRSGRGGEEKKFPAPTGNRTLEPRSSKFVFSSFLWSSWISFTCWTCVKRVGDSVLLRPFHMFPSFCLVILDSRNSIGRTRSSHSYSPFSFKVFEQGLRYNISVPDLYMSS